MKLLKTRVGDGEIVELPATLSDVSIKTDKPFKHVFVALSGLYENKNDMVEYRCYIDNKHDGDKLAYNPAAEWVFTVPSQKYDTAYFIQLVPVKEDSE
jgi:hypothetical protein